MAFTPDIFNVVVQPFGGDGIRFVNYQTDDDAETVTSAGYFVGVESYGARVNDLVFVSPRDGEYEPYVVTIIDIDVLGNGTAQLGRADRTMQTFDTVEDLEDTRVLWAVNHVYVAGYYAVGDGGAAHYKRVVSEPDFGGIQSLDGAWWEITETTVKPEMFGILTGVNQQTTIAALMSWAAERGITIQWGEGPYVWSEIEVRQNDMNVRWRFPPKGTVFRCDKAVPNVDYQADHFLQLSTNTIRQISLTGTGLFQGGARVTLDSTSDIVTDDTLLMFFSSRVIETDHRNQARHGFSVPVSAVIDATTVEVSKTIPYTMLVGDTNNVAITAVDLVNNHFTCASLIGEARSDMRYRIHFNTVGGVASTVELLPSDFDPATGRYTFGTTNATLPAGLQIGDTINIERQIDVIISRSVKLDMEGRLIIERPNMHTGAVAGDNGFRGFRVSRGLRPRIHDLVTRNFSEAGLVLENCYGFSIKHHEHWNCNRAYDTTNGTGYGVSIFNSGWGDADDIKGFGCRRTLDVGGTQQVSWNNKISNVEGYGGGTAYTGDRFWPVGTTENSVVGSHGCAWGTVYINSRGVDTSGVINCRGSDEVVRGVYGAGKMEQLVNVFSGDGLDADGLYYTDGHPDWVTDWDYAYPTPQADRKLMDVVRIAAYNIIPTKPHHVSNIVARGVWRSLISLESGGDAGVGPITVGGKIDIQTDDQNGLLSDFTLFRKSGAGPNINVNGPIWCGPVSIRNHPASPKVAIRMIDMSVFNWLNGAFFRAPNGEVGAVIEDDAVFKLPTYRVGTCTLDIRPQNRDRTYHMRGGQVELEQAGDASTGPRSALVDVSASVLSGTTGTDGRITVAFQPVGGTQHLYVENRMGVLEYVWIGCTAAAV